MNTPAQVRYGPTKELEFTEREVSMWTYSASDMCLSPANTTGFWKPGNIFDVVLKGLEPNTRYFYSYGSEGVRNDFKFFFGQLNVENLYFIRCLSLFEMVANCPPSYTFIM